MTKVPFFDLREMHAATGVQEEIDAAVLRVSQSGRYILGRELEAFEAAFAAYCENAYCVATGSGLAALELALRALGVGPGDEVIVPAHTFVGTWLAVSSTGARPVPVEPGEGSFLIDTDLLEAAVTPRTRAVLPVHLYGHPEDMDAVRDFADRHGLAVLEDAAQAHGARRNGRRVGSGHAVAFSFYPGKNLGALGDGGAIVTDDAELAGRLRLLRNYGSREKYVHEVKGATPGWTRSSPPCSPRSCRTWTTGTNGAARSPAATRRRSSACPASPPRTRRPGPSTSGTSTYCALRSAIPCAGGWRSRAWER